MSEDPADGAVAGYKRLLQAIVDNRPSGTRGRLAAALGTNRSFVSQLVNAAYAMPIPVQHLPTIFDVCHVSASDRDLFLAAYDQAHPGRRGGGIAESRTRSIALEVPDLGDKRRNQALDDMLAEYARHLVRFRAVLD